MIKIGLAFFLGLPIWFSSVETKDTPHKFYVSVTNVEYSQSEESLQIISRLFIDDMEEMLKERYEITANLATENESDLAERYTAKYFNSKFKVYINGQAVDLNFLGRRYDKDLMVCFIEVVNLPEADLKSIEIENTLLIDMFEEQRNLVHFKVKGVKKSVVLGLDNTKAMLNL